MEFLSVFPLAFFPPPITNKNTVQSFPLVSLHIPISGPVPSIFNLGLSRLLFHATYTTVAMNHIIKHHTMAQELVQIVTLRFKPSLQHRSEIPLSFRDVSRQLQEMPGVSATYLGEQMEHPGVWTWAIRWASPAALDAFLASPSLTSWMASIRAVAESYTFWRGVIRGNLGAALKAPCTEIFTAYGASDDWLDAHMKPFATNVDEAKLPGYWGSGYGDFGVVDQHGSNTPTAQGGHTISMILGWDSREAHLAERGDGKRA